MVKAMYFGGERYARDYVGAIVGDHWTDAMHNYRDNIPYYYDINPIYTTDSVTKTTSNVTGYSFSKSDESKDFGEKYVVSALTWNNEVYLGVIGDTTATGVVRWLKYSDVASQLSMGG